jgi:TRAP-type C4-dicarboxylate transport system substrate-binding protein
MKKIVYIWIVLVLAVTFCLTGSAESAPKVIELKAATTTPPMAPPGAALTAWAKKFEEASGGRVKITIYYASSLFPAADIMRSVLAGVADISDFWHIEGPQMFPLASWGSMPGIDWPDPYKATKIWREMIKEFPEFTKQYKGLKLLYPTLVGQATMLYNTREKPVKSVADLKGLKINGHGYAAKWLKNLGATPVFVPYEDTYMSIERGIVDGHTGPWGWMEGSGTLELTPYHADTGMVGSLMCQLLVMNADSFNRLPPDIQKIFDDLDEFATKIRIDMEMGKEKKYVPISKKEWGHKYFKFSPEDKKAMLDAAKPLHEELIALGEKQGVPARKFYETLMRKIEGMR